MSNKEEQEWNKNSTELNVFDNQLGECWQILATKNSDCGQGDGDGEQKIKHA